MTSTTIAPAAMVDALNNTFGKHAGKRASHAKGLCAHGAFTPTPEVQKFVDGPLFSRGTLKAILRFSVGGGNPGVSDKSRSVRGLSMRLSGGEDFWDLLLISEPVFFAATPESFVSFLAARVPDTETQKPDPQKVAAHNARFPDCTRQPALLAAHAAPASYASTPYYSNNAFIFQAEDGRRQTARIIATPAIGTRYLTDDEEQQFPDNFLQDELTRRLNREPVEFELYAQLPADGDSLDDPSQHWVGAGMVSLGRLRVTALDDSQACDDVLFVPLNLPAGIAVSDDPILHARGAAYGISLARRKKD
ncbi:catalase [Duganella callida]|uniref:Catalase-related peroxidase n=1 Tax=Duganella callida TaxID=2561932 RepID=A0A4Y9S8D7_9BURK|nr:catalase [Duganella callida]TFW15790.1 catalase [Duganella callida]